MFHKLSIFGKINEKDLKTNREFIFFSGVKPMLNVPQLEPEQEDVPHDARYGAEQLGYVPAFLICSAIMSRACCCCSIKAVSWDATKTAHSNTLAKL